MRRRNNEMEEGDVPLVIQVLNRMEENLRDSIYWRSQWKQLNDRSRAACKEMISLMGEEHGTAAQRTAIEIYKRHGLVGSMRDEAPCTTEDEDCVTPKTY